MFSETVLRIFNDSGINMAGVLDNKCLQLQICASFGHPLEVHNTIQYVQLTIVEWIQSDFV